MGELETGWGVVGVEGVDNGRVVVDDDDDVVVAIPNPPPLEFATILTI